MLYGCSNDAFYLTKNGSKFVLHVSTTRIPGDDRIEVEVSNTLPYQEVRSADQKTFAAMWLDSNKQILVLVFQKPVGQATGVALCVSEDTCCMKVISNAKNILERYPPPQNKCGDIVKWLNN